MILKERLNAFITLGEQLQKLEKSHLNNLYQNAQAHNSWFSEREVKASLNGLISYLEEKNLRNWIAEYKISDNQTPKKVGVIMAGNIPMVGIHDFITVLLSGNILLAKLSSQDPFLIKEIARMLVEIAPKFSKQIEFVEQMKEIDAIIATGSNNTARYFEHYFSKYPNVIRKNRSSCAVLKGDETVEILKKLSDDILQYYGLGCRNVSKVFIPKDFKKEFLMEALEESSKAALQNHKYANNYDYNKSIYLLNQVPHLDNGFLMLTESEVLVSPISVLYYEYYENETELNEKLKEVQNEIQCIVSHNAWWENSVDFGKAQCPTISDYADNVDTMDFLLEL